LYNGIAITESALNGVEFDQPPSEPTRRLFICTTPRSGSYLLVRQLTRAGIGVAHEYLNPVNSSVIVPRAFGVADAVDLASYLDWLEKNRTTPNGVFAAKLPWEHFEVNPQVIDLWIRKPGSVCVFLYRRQLLSQAVSLRAARHSGVWDVGGEVSTALRTLRGVSEQRETDHLAYRILSWNGMWRFFFESHGIPAIDLVYEDFVADQPKVIADIAAKLDVACEVPDPEPHSGSGTKSSAEARNRYVERWLYRRDGAPSLGYSGRLAAGAILDTARHSAKALSSRIPLKRGHR
jgi:LPS sulfotransferase NodH